MTFDEAIKEPGIYERETIPGQFILVTRYDHMYDRPPIDRSQNGVVFFNVRSQQLPAKLGNDSSGDIAEPILNAATWNEEWVKRDHLELVMVLKTECSSDA